MYFCDNFVGIGRKSQNGQKFHSILWNLRKYFFWRGIFAMSEIRRKNATPETVNFFGSDMKFPCMYLSANYLQSSLCGWVKSTYLIKPTSRLQLCAV
jgi:hypothetical protein